MATFKMEDIIETEPRSVWREKISKLILSEDRTKHICTAYFGRGEDKDDIMELPFDLEDLDGFVSPLRYQSIVRDATDGREYYVPFLVALDSSCNCTPGAKLYSGNRTELVYLYEGSTAPLVYEMVYIPQNSKRFAEVTEEEIDPEFRKQLHRWWNGEFSIIGDDEGRILD